MVPAMFESEHTSKDVSEHILQARVRVLRSKAEDVDTVQGRKHIRRNDLKRKHSSERSPEDFETASVRSRVVMQRCWQYISAR
jgi:hypothetical protein